MPWVSVNNVYEKWDEYGIAQVRTNELPEGEIAYVPEVLLPDGRVFCVPASATSARTYNSATDTLNTASGTYLGTNAYVGGVLLPGGSVFCARRSDP